MAPRISLALAIHNHQPVGNFGWVFAEVYDRAYLPLLESLERHPGRPAVAPLHGPLLEWLAAERPEFLARLGALAARQQVELLGGGLYEPILASLPEHDRVDQLVRMADRVESITGRRPRGAWLAERVWEPDLPTSLVEAGYQWTVLDDQHFRAAAIPEENLWGAYTTEDQGSLLTVFGTEQGLRYRIPFGTVESVIDYLRDHATEDGNRVGMMGDDGEKFGAWPTTYEHCWGGGRWVERFFEALEANASWLTTVTPSQWLDREAPIGRVYVPTSSTRRWASGRCRPTRPSCSAGSSTTRSPEKDPAARWLRGGFWRNFQVKYREVNDLHKQMLRTSAKVAAMAGGPRAGPGGRPPPPRPVQRLLLARAVRRHLHQPHAARDVRAPDRRRGPGRRRARDRAGGGAARPRHGRARRGPARGGRAGRGREARRGRRDRGLGPARGASRAGGGHAPAARGVPRDPARARRRRGRSGHGRGRRRATAAA